ncbi:MAG TPA: tripartite tricarboxylate transporter TctB family protein [Usitatibacter sp.]|nr:tripartite tricarboxylate transporter TctB family protein [Usitatibacter sp.]
MKIGHPKNFWGGVLFAAIGLMFAVIAFGVSFGGSALLPGYAMGSPARMGPGFFPFWLGAILLALGVIISVTAIKTEGGKEGELERFHWGPVAYVLTAIVLFGLLLKVVGMLLAGMVLIVGASLGSGEFKLREILPLSIFLVVFTALVFVVGLKLPIPLCPDIDMLQTFAVCRA